MINKHPLSSKQKGLYLNIEHILRAFVTAEALPETFIDAAKTWFLPLLLRIVQRQQVHQSNAISPFFVGINGAQGSGKSTLSALLVRLLEECHGLRAQSMSIDDFYLTKHERVLLSQTVHPLFATRGVPGTHDTDLLMNTLTELSLNHPCRIPIFDKATDDRCPDGVSISLTEPMDVVILEGWCVGATAQHPDALVEPVNDVEGIQDANAIWRTYVNKALARDYQCIFDTLNYMVMLKAPSFQQIYAWRLEQEHKMQNKNIAAGKPMGGMSDLQIAHFIAHYQRITEHQLEQLPAQCDEVFQLDQNRDIISCQLA
jgi:D-glycerate 3-kinase